MRLFLLLCATAGLLLAAPVPKEKAKADAELILGKWEFEKFDSAGGPAPPEGYFAGMGFEFKKDNLLTSTPPTKLMEKAEEGTYELNTEAKLKELDFSVGKESTGKALYEIDGDTLKICISQQSSKVRPAELKADMTAQTAILTFKRAKADQKKDK